MKRLLTIALGFALLALVKPFHVGAVDAPHVNTCSTCHTAALSPDSTGFNNNCLSCHSSGHAASSKPFSVADQVNTSHKWSGSDTVPAAGAQPPVTGALTQVMAYTGNEMACVRCHNPHSQENDKYQRIANDNDQLCLDCHRSRNVRTHTAGSHPILVSYSSAYKGNPAGFYKTPQNANPANPSSDLNYRLVNKSGGKLLCTTCHGVHNADSRSTTVDGFATISSGDGNLLRTDTRGKKVAVGQPDNLNLCTNCHAGKTNHNAGGQDIQCVDCHGAHVDFDPNDPTGAKGPNIDLIRRNLPGKTNQIFFRYTGSRREYKNEAGTGVCQGCHTVPTSIAQHASTDPKVCNTCHSHNSAKGAFSASCNSCHGYPPMVTSSGAAHPPYSDCSMCHNTSDPSLHMNGTVNVYTACNTCHDYPPAYPNGTPKANSHQSSGHLYGCSTCHSGTTANGATISNTSLHMNGAYDVQAGSGVSFTYTYAASGGTCSNISCHGNTSATWGGTAACLVCHSVAQGNRAAITSQFSANSHHIQGTLSNTQCYQCHWEANSDGSVNGTYHHSKTPGAPVELVIYGAGSRPSAYSAGVTAIQYTANGTRSEIQKINSHCLGCHSDQNNTTTPFGDGKTPKQYAWDGTSVAARYLQSGTTTWGKYSSVTNAAKKRISKAYSAHGNAAANKRGWDTVNGVDGAITNTSGTASVLCYDCHNSHGSAAEGVTTRYASATVNGGILKNTVAGQGGYSISYKPYSAGSKAHKDKRSAGASICLDCHMNPTATQTPWGYTSTYGATQQILGYWDSPFMSYSTCGPEQRYPYKKKNGVSGGHFGASYAMSSTPTSTIGGLCTPCHDPHGVSPTLGANEQYAVPLLKGTWITSPYKEDVAPANNTWLTNFAGYGEGVQYHIDQNTFGSGILGAIAGMSQSVNQSAGLCLGCHPQSTLTAAASSSNPNPWKSKNRIHESVKGWKTSDSTVEHNYSCSKCHAAHTSSVLPRLMVTDCLDSTHKGRVGYNPSPVIAASSGGDGGSGSGRIPGSYSGGGWDDYPMGLPGLSAPGNVSVTCHDSANANGYGTDGTNQSWNTVTPWAPAMISGPTAVTGGLRVLLHMDEASWNGTPNEVKDSSGGNNNGTAYNGANTVAGGISNRAGSFNGTNSSVPITYSTATAPMDNFTLEAWIQPTATHEIDAELTSGTSGTYGQRYLFGADQMGAVNGGMGVSAGTNGISVYEHGDNYMPALAVYSGTISSSQWTHIAVVYLDKRPSIYVNGVLVRTGLRSLRSHVYASHVVGGGSYGYFSGLVDEVAIYDKALTAADIQLHSQQQCSVIATDLQATINWTTFANSTSYVDYGLTTAYGSTIENSALVTNHSVILPNLTNYSTYHYRVRSVDIVGNETVSGDNTFNIATCIVAESPFAPTAISAVAGNAQATISWTAGSGSSSSLIRYGTASGNYTSSIDPAASPQTITGLANGTTIYYQVGSKNSTGTVWSDQYSVTPVGPPSAPTGISSIAGNAQATISWTAGTGATSSLIRYGTVSGTYTTTIDPAASPQAITSLANGTIYYYQVGAKNSSGTTWSTQYTVTPVALPSAPIGISSLPGNAQATISWTAGTGATSSLIRYGTVSGTYTTTIDPASSPQAVTGLANGTIYYYQVGAKNSAGTTWSVQYSVTPVLPVPSAPTGISSVAGNTQATITWTVGANATSSLIRYGTSSGSYPTTINPATSPRVITGLANGTIYYYQVGAYNTAGTTWSAQYTVTPVGPPNAPTGISSVSGNTQATISWTAGAGATSSLIRYGTASGSYTTTIDPAASPQPIASLANGTTYYYQVGAKNSAGTTWSGQYSVKPIAPPSAPTGISSVTDNAQITITWTAGAGATSSLIKYGTASGTYTTTINPASSPRAITGLVNGTTYYYQVGAYNTAGTTWSSEYSATPQIPAVAPTGIFVTTGDTQATISWTAGIGATSSAIRYGTTSGTYTTTIDPATSPKTITGLTNGIPIYYQVGAKNAWGITWSSEYSFTLTASSSQTSWTTPGTYTYVVPSGVTSITTVIKGGGGAGGLQDNVGNQAPGASGDLVSTTIAVAPGDQLTVYVADGGFVTNNYDTNPGSGGTGYVTGGSGSPGSGDVGTGAWSYGGSGGGGSSAITLSTTLLAQAKGGAGGRSSDYDDYDYWYYDGGYYVAGSGGAGGGTDYPAVTTAGAGGAGGGIGLRGAAGAVSIVVGLTPPPAPTVTPAGSYYYGYDSTEPPQTPKVLQWSSVTAPSPFGGDPIEYNVELNGVLQGWQSGTSLTINAGDYPASYTWRVQARDKAIPAAVSPWSGYDTFRALYW